MKVKLIVEGGDMKPGPAVSQQLGPMGINIGKVISDVNSATAGFKGVKVPVELDVDPKTKDFSIEVFSPPMSELIKKDLKIDKGSGTPGTVKSGNITFEALLGIAKTKLPNLLARDLKAAVKLAIGSCVSLGILIDNKDAKEIMPEVDSGKYDKEIDEEITVPSDEKKERIEKFFSVVKAKQERDQRALEEAKAAEEAAKAEEAAAAPAPAAEETKAKEEIKKQP